MERAVTRMVKSFSPKRAHLLLPVPSLPKEIKHGIMVVTLDTPLPLMISLQKKRRFLFIKHKKITLPSLEVRAFFLMRLIGMLV